jgi:hypothetical protein
MDAAEIVVREVQGARRFQVGQFLRESVRTMRFPGEETRFVGVGDFNGDHQVDIVAPSYNLDDVFVLLNTGVVKFFPTSPLTFKPQTVGTTSPPQTVTLTNTGVKALKILSMKVQGQFDMTSTCGSSLAAGANCSISVTFSPKTQGAKTGIVAVDDSASSKPQVIELSGTGTSN